MTDPVFWIAAACLVLLVFVRLFFWLFVFTGWWRHSKQAKISTDLPPVSVIIAARNEENNLRRHLPAVLEQDYPDYEVIVVDDCSDDNSREVLNRFALDSDKLYITWVPKAGKFRRGKKVAVSIGIRAANHEHMVFIDADCSPASKNWLRYMAGSFRKGSEIVLGYGSYEHKQGVLNAMLRYDTLLIAMMYGGMATRIKPYMGVGRNLAYKKSLWLQRGGFKGFNNVLSGDDDLFVNACATKNNTAVVLLAEAKTISRPPVTIIQWIQQKSRHMTSSKHYKAWQRFLLAAEPVSRSITPFVLMGIYCLYPERIYMYVLIAVWVLLKFIQFFVLHKSRKYTGEKKLFPYFPLIDLFLPFFYVIFVLVRLRQRNNIVWK
ncbi:MAG: glycosyltransferase [Bacteroidota bacterium]|nr:glycosyltransferase [Bacteroidota bacterium]